MKKKTGKKVSYKSKLAVGKANKLAKGQGKKLAVSKANKPAKTMPARSNKGGSVRGKDRAAAVKAMNTRTKSGPGNNLTRKAANTSNGYKRSTASRANARKMRGRG